MPALHRLTLVVGCLFAGSVLLVAAAPQAAVEENAKTWLEKRQAIEDYLRTAEPGKIEDISVGVTKPKRVYLPPGGLVDRMAWKVIPPGLYSGYWESYKSEIAAYELDKLLALDMVPPTVERRLKGDLGAAIMWVSPTKSFKELGGAPTAPGAKLPAWNRQLVRAKMFDNLIANIDPNLGNWLVDPAWNLILIDHTRAFTTKKDMVHKLTRFDQELWERTKAQTVDTLTPVLSKWIGKGEIRAIVERRDRMQALLDKLIAEGGPTAAFVQ